MQWTHSELHRDFRHATPASSCWTMSPCCERRFARKHAPKDSNPDQLGWNQSCCQLHQGRTILSGNRETRTHKSRSRPPVFKTGSSSGRMASDCKLRELESNQRPPGSEPGVTTNSNYPASFVFNDTHTFARFASSCGGRSRTCGHVVQSHVFLPTETTPQSTTQ